MTTKTAAEIRGAFLSFFAQNGHTVLPSGPVVLQHDTVLRPNQCGGPVVNLDGQAVGVNIARAGRVASYALPASVVLPLLEELKSGRLAPEASTMTTTAAVTEKPEQ